MEVKAVCLLVIFTNTLTPRRQGVVGTNMFNVIDARRT